MRERKWTDAVDGVLLSGIDASHEVDFADNEQKCLPVSRVNLLVGANNAGKSRFLRAIAVDKLQRFRVSDQEWPGDPRAVLRRAADAYPDVKERVENSKRAWSRGTVQHSELDQWLLTANRQESRLREAASEREIYYEARRHAGVVEDIRKHLGNIPHNVGNTLQLDSHAAARFKGMRDALTAVEQFPSMAAPAATYVPVLRGLRSVARAEGRRTYDNAYLHATQLDYALPGTVRIETGLTLYQDLRTQLLGKREERERVKEYEDFLSKNFFERRHVTLTPHEQDQAVYIYLDGQEHPIHHVGDGLQSVIVLTYQAFVTRQTPGLFFVAEPELFLHPGMQRRLLNFFLHETPHLYFITTHSNHLLDLSMDERGITVYNFQRVPRASATDAGDGSMVTRVRRVNGGDQSSLALLGVRVSSVFLVNATVWVEGITDRLYLREMLRLYVASKEGDAAFRRMEEDTHYSFVEYGGSNITHWSFLQKKEDHPIEVNRLCSNGMLMIDADDSANAGTAKHKRRAELESALANRLLVTEGREVENMLPERVVRAVLKRYGETEAAVATVMRSAYRDEPLGRWLDAHLGSTKARKSGYGEDSGTVKGKTDFCDRAIDEMREGDFKFADLPPEVQKLVERIYGFIVKQNQ